MPKFIKFFATVALILPAVSLGQGLSFFGRNHAGPGLCQVDILQWDGQAMEIMMGVIDSQGSYLHFEVVSLNREADGSSYRRREATEGRDAYRVHTLKVNGQNPDKPQFWRDISFQLGKEYVRGVDIDRTFIFNCADLRRPTPTH